jgi:L-lysine 6-transaminase
MSRLNPTDVFPILKRHLLVDGFDMVVDLRKSQGHYLYDTLNNRKYLDLFGFFATAPVSHNHPELNNAAFREKIGQVALFKPSNSDFYTIPMAEFVETFSRVAIPKYLPHLFFISGGALAVENALKAAMDWKVKKNFAAGEKAVKGHKIIHFFEAFHGRSGYTLSMTNTADPRKYQYYAMFEWPRIINPKLSFPVTEKVLEAAKKVEVEAVAQIKKAFKENPRDVAAIVIEPIQCEGGDNHFRKEFLQQLRALADENEALLIFDEVQTGVGITGQMWCHQHFEVKPDVMAFGKKTQICGVLAGPRLDEIQDNVFTEPSRINSTWGGSLVDMVRFQKFLEIIEKEKLVENARKQGAYFLGELQKLQKEFPEAVSNARGLGLLIAFDLPSTEDRSEFLKICLDNGLIVLSCGHYSIRVRPALDIGRDQIDEAMEIFRKSLKTLQDRRAQRQKQTATEEAKYEI